MSEASGQLSPPRSLKNHCTARRRWRKLDFDSETAAATVGARFDPRKPRTPPVAVRGKPRDLTSALERKPDALLAPSLTNRDERV
jgi:hypothetical protein